MKKQDLKEIKLTDREIEILKALNLLGYTYIARDRDNELYAYYNNPKKLTYVWDSIKDNYIIYTELFNFIKWEDEEPTKIDDLLKGV